MNYQYYIPTQHISTPNDKKVVLIGGCFDIIHFGHMQFLEKAKQTGDYLIVALESDERIINDKKRTPIHTQKERAYNLLALRFVDYVIMLPLLNGFDDYLALVQNIKPHSIAITSNDPQQINKQKQTDAIGAQLIIVTDMIGEFSSSAIIRHNYNNSRQRSMHNTHNQKDFL
ncbi:MAG TPA: adenylyltransferase/cytidyltransferase family protein [Candidatus Babeliales bacterium]|jgi:cytidyltransferase-like protein|nr:adenylyltransferase/cytidyltransferase family protein [Candidatus Babeliales bacterium]